MKVYTLHQRNRMTGKEDELQEKESHEEGEDIMVYGSGLSHLGTDKCVTHDEQLIQQNSN